MKDAFKINDSLSVNYGLIKITGFGTGNTDDFIFNLCDCEGVAEN